MILGGFIGAHLSPSRLSSQELLQNPLSSSNSGRTSARSRNRRGVFGLWLFFRVKEKRVGTSDRWRYLTRLHMSSRSVGDRPAGMRPGARPSGHVTCVSAGISLANPYGSQVYPILLHGCGRQSELPEVEQLSGMGFHDLGGMSSCSRRWSSYPSSSYWTGGRGNPVSSSPPFCSSMFLRVSCWIFCGWRTRGTWTDTRPVRRAAVFLVALYFGVRGHRPPQEVADPGCSTGPDAASADGDLDARGFAGYRSRSAGTPHIIEAETRPVYWRTRTPVTFVGCHQVSLRIENNIVCSLASHSVVDAIE